MSVYDRLLGTAVDDRPKSLYVPKPHGLSIATMLEKLLGRHKTMPHTLWQLIRH